MLSQWSLQHFRHQNLRLQGDILIVGGGELSKYPYQISISGRAIDRHIISTQQDLWYTYIYIYTYTHTHYYTLISLDWWSYWATDVGLLVGGNTYLDHRPLSWPIIIQSHQYPLVIKRGNGKWTILFRWNPRETCIWGDFPLLNLIPGG